MPKSRICYIVSDVNESYQLNAIAEGVYHLGYDVSFIFIASTIPKIAEILRAKKFLVNYIEYNGKTDFLKVFLKLYLLLGKINPDIVHTHLQTASLLGLTVAKMRGIKKRVLTRHHSTEHHDYHPHAVYYDKYCNALATKIIAISRNVERVLIEREKVNPTRIITIHHGFRLEDFKIDTTAVTRLKAKYQLDNNYPVIGMISRFVEGKGVQFVIPAFAKVLQEYPKAKLVFAGFKGNYSTEIFSLLKKNLRPENYLLIEFESQIFELYRTFDIFVHAPINAAFEAFGQTYVESLALEIPSVFTLSGIANDFVVDRKNALVVDFCDSKAIAEAIKMILEDALMRENIINQGKIDIENLFPVNRMISSLDNMYSSL